MTGQLTIGTLAGIGFVVGVAEAFFFPAYTALLPTLLPPEPCSPVRYRSSSGWPPSSPGGCPPTRSPTP